MEKDDVYLKLNNLIKIDNLTKLILEFNKIMKSILEFDESVIYFYDEDILKVRAYRYFKSNVYTKVLNLAVSNTLFEETFLFNKALVTRKLDYIDYVKNTSYLSSNSRQIISLPINSGNKTIATIEFKQPDVFKVDLDYITSLVNVFAVKLVDFLLFDTILTNNQHLREYADKLNLITFEGYENELVISNEEFRKVVTTIVGKKLEEKVIVKNRNSYLVNITYTSANSYHGFIQKISNYFIDKEKKEETQPVFSKENLYRKINQLIDDNEISTLIRFSFKENFQKDVYEIINKEFDEIYKYSHEFIVVTKIYDKRTLRHILNRIEDNFDKIVTLEVRTATLTVCKEYFDKNSVLDVLDVMINQNQKNYSTDVLKRYFDKRTLSKSNKKLVNSRTFKIYARAILNYYSESVGYKVESELSNFKFDDNRFSLIVFDEILKKVLKKVKQGGHTYYIDIPSYLVKEMHMLDFLTKKCAKIKYAKENICFVVTEEIKDSVVIDFVEKMISNKFRVGLVNEFDMMFQKNHSLKVSTLFLDVSFTEDSSLFFDCLKKIYEKYFTDFIFLVNSNEEFIEFKRLDFGTCLTNKRFDINIVD